jgi:beta-glucosidase-like glycosyl hydrolase
MARSSDFSDAKDIRAFICGIEGKTLSDDEKKFLEDYQPLGVILFGRNCDNADQIKALTDSIKRHLRHSTPLILIDQEGGRVARLRGEQFFSKEQFAKDLVHSTIAERTLPAPADFTALLEDHEFGYVIDRVRNYYYQMSTVMASLGINVNCAPVCDIQREGTHEVIGDRSFGGDIDVIAPLARAADEGMRQAGVQSIIKHMPGHGRATKDSHEELPHVDASLDDLDKNDFEVFRRLRDMNIAMTAHIRFDVFGDMPATMSKDAVKYIRERIGFDGLIITDCITMGALREYSTEERANNAWNAGCDIVLHSKPHGDLEGIRKLADAAPILNPGQIEKISRLHCFQQQDAGAATGL